MQIKQRQILMMENKCYPVSPSITKEARKKKGKRNLSKSICWMCNAKKYLPTDIQILPRKSWKCGKRFFFLFLIFISAMCYSAVASLSRLASVECAHRIHRMSVALFFLFGSFPLPVVVLKYFISPPSENGKSDIASLCLPKKNLRIPPSRRCCANILKRFEKKFFSRRKEISYLFY